MFKCCLKFNYRGLFNEKWYSHLTRSWPPQQFFFPSFRYLLFYTFHIEMIQFLMSSLIRTPSLTALLLHSGFHQYSCNVCFFVLFFLNGIRIWVLYLCPYYTIQLRSFCQVPCWYVLPALGKWTSFALCYHCTPGFHLGWCTSTLLIEIQEYSF